MKLCIVCYVTEGDGKEFTSYELFPLAYEVKVYVLEGGGGVCIMDFGHNHVGVFVHGVVGGVVAIRVGVAWGKFN